jgi:hypothetical protein
LRSPNVWVGPRPVAVAGCPIWKSKTRPDWTFKHYLKGLYNMVELVNTII